MSIGLDLLGASDYGNTYQPSLSYAEMRRRIPVVGAYDLAAQTRQIDTIKQPTVSIARAMLKQAQATINQARTAGASLPGATARDNCYWKLDYYTKELGSKTDPTEPFVSEWPDLRKWVLQAFIEANAVEEGAAYAQANWNQMWTDIGTAILALPQKARDAVYNAATWLVPWYIWVGGAAALAAALYVVLKTGTKTVVKRYLP